MTESVETRVRLLERADEEKEKVIEKIETKLEDLIALVNKGKGIGLFVGLVFTLLQAAVAYKILLGG